MVAPSSGGVLTLLLNVFFGAADTFDESGACSGTVPEEFQPIVGVRVRINKDNQQWLFITKFAIVFEAVDQ
jgi:hypothetical protein